MVNKFTPTEDERKLVAQMVAVGITREQIAQVIRDGIDPKTLAKHFKEEIETSATKANAKVGASLYNQAINGNTTAAIWWTKTRMRWSEPKQQIDLDIPRGIKVRIVDSLTEKNGSS